jgi:hypothetical protein
MMGARIVLPPIVDEPVQLVHERVEIHPPALPTSSRIAASTNLGLFEGLWKLLYPSSQEE